MNFLVIEVSDRVALVSARQAIGASRREQKTCGQASLTRMPMADEGHVSDFCAFIDSHGKDPSLGSKLRPDIITIETR